MFHIIRTTEAPWPVCESHANVLDHYDKKTKTLLKQALYFCKLRVKFPQRRSILIILNDRIFDMRWIIYDGFL